MDANHWLIDRSALARLGHGTKPATPDRPSPPTTSANAACARPRPNKRSPADSTSEDIIQDRLDIRSYIDAIRKHKADVLTGIRNALTGKPWQRYPNMTTAGT
ncbi:MAG: hypothetical protein ACRDS1_15915 [Pseudonocardiaceae bacterium]